jgi:hypothetical protein
VSPTTPLPQTRVAHMCQQGCTIRALPTHSSAHEIRRGERERGHTSCEIFTLRHHFPAPVSTSLLRPPHTLDNLCSDKIIAKCKQLGPDSPEARAVACMFAGNGFSHPSDAGRLQVLSGDAAAATSAAFQEGEGVPELVRERVIGIIKCNAFSPAASFGFAADRRSPMLPSQDRHLGLWVLPAMLNHACVGNCQRFFVGDFMFIRAAQVSKARFSRHPSPSTIQRAFACTCIGWMLP